MKLLVLRDCFVVDGFSDERVPMKPGDTIDIPDKHAEAAIVRGLAIECDTTEDRETGAPAREKAAARGAAERG